MSVAYNSGNQALALASIRACQGLPGGTVSNSGWLSGFAWVLGYPVAYGRQPVHSLQHAQQADVLDVVRHRVVSGEEWTALSRSPVTIRAE